MNSYTNQFTQMATELRNEISDKAELIQMKADRAEKDMQDYIDFCDFCENKEKMDSRKTDNIFSDLFEIGMFINMLEVMNDKELKYLKYKTEFTKDNLVSKLIPILSRLELKTRRQKKIEKILC